VSQPATDLDYSVFDYSESKPPIRPDLPEAYRTIWRQLSQPGNWFNAEDRLAIAREVRVAGRCALCAQRKNALSPVDAPTEKGEKGEKNAHDCESNLPGALVDAVHRITTDASRLSPSWLQQFYAAGYSDGHYVELLGIVVALISIDTFQQAMGFKVESLPAPQEGQPSQYRPPGAADSGAWVDTVSPENLTPPEADIYSGMPQTGNVLSAMSLVPGSVRMLVRLSNAQYLPAHAVPDPGNNGDRALSRSQIELLAGRVSSLNQCFY